jgi:hypothetical protein
MALEDSESAIFAMKKEDRTPAQQKYYEKRVGEKKAFKKKMLIRKENCNKVYNSLFKQLDSQSYYALAFESFHSDVIDVFDAFLKEDEYFGSKTSALQRRLDRLWGDLNDLGALHKDKNYLIQVNRILNLADLSIQSENAK